jgi:ubiquinone/menaquinone biosynthesis C-methylase UbiE
MATLIRPDDVRRLAEMVRETGIGRIAGRILRSKRRAVQSAWDHVESTRSSWWEVDEVVRRWNRLITGTPTVDYQTYVARKYLSRGRGLRGLSIGCGTGAKEIRWAATNKFSTIDAYDLSSSRIRYARESAATTKWGERLSFQVGDVHRLQLVPASYDVVIFDNALHHCSPLTPVIRKVHGWLKEHGILVLNEYVGPDRFQWTDEQVEVTNALLRLLPERLRTMKDGTRKNRMARYGSLAVRINDPSEAAESSSMMNLVQEYFAISELKPYGGAILANLLKDIAHNFEAADVEAKEWLLILFDFEDRLMKAERIRSDYCFAVMRKSKADVRQGIR